MVKRTYFLLVLASVLTTMLVTVNCDDDGDDDDKNCAENMEYSESGSACPRTCDDVANLSEEDKKCTEKDAPRCVCKAGFVLNYGKCVPESDCTCPDNAEYTCLKCDRTCEDVTRMGDPKGCLEICKLGCECKEGYVVDSGKCIPQAQCACPQNSEFLQNGTCRRTCEDVATMNYQPCTNPGRAGCYCKQGFALNASACIPQNECHCKENAKYSDCNKACQLTCDNYSKPPEVCIDMCVVGCACEKGYVRSVSGACVLPEKCSSTS